MRRALIFLVLFCGGLALLLYFSEEKKEESKERLGADQELLVREGRQNETPFIQIPDLPNPPGGDPEDPSQANGESAISAVVARGEVFGIVREDSPRLNKLYDFHFDDAQPSGGGFYDVQGITVNLYNVETEKIRTTLVAESGTVKIELRDGRLVVGQAERIQLVNAVVTLHEGSPMAPIDLILPVAEADLLHNSIYSDAEVRVEGEGLLGTGLGLIAAQSNQPLVLKRNGYIRLVAEDSTEVELFASPKSAIEFRRIEINEELEKVELRLPDGGRLVVKGDKGSVVEGEDLTLNGRVFLLDTGEEGGPDDRKQQRVFHAEYARIVDNVVFTRNRDRVTGGVAEIFFYATGLVQRVLMSEDPVAEGVMNFDPSAGVEEGPVEVRISGVGPMELEYNEDSPVARFKLPGPARIVVPKANLELAAEESVGGSFWGRGIAHMQLRGAVQGKFEDMIFSGSELALRGSEPDDEGLSIFCETQQPARIQGFDSGGNPVDLRSEKDLQLKLESGKLFVILGREVTLELLDKELWSVVVGELRDLDLENGTFLASQGVKYAGPLGSGTAFRAKGHSREHLEFFGDGEHPAVYDVNPDRSEELEAGLVRAQHIDLEGHRVRADTQVELRFKGSGYEEEFDSEWFELRPGGEVGEEGPTLFEFEAGEVSRAVLRGEGLETTATAKLVTGNGVFHQDEDGKTWVELLNFTASGDVSANYEGKAGSFRATGDRIIWNAGDGVRLEGPPGQRVEARGRFQDEGLPYVLTAAWIEYRGEELQALFPEITLDRPAALPQLLIGRSTTELHSGQAEWMTADGAGLLLSGKAHFVGETGDGEELDLLAGSMHLLRTSEGDERSQGVQELVAWGGFELHVRDDLFGQGEIFQAGYQVLRMEGRPARFEVRGFVWESNDIEYDVPRVLVTTDQGKVTGATGSPWEGWVATYESLQPFETADSMMMVMRNPVLRSGKREIRATWATFWLDRQEWLKKSQEWLAETDAQKQEEPIGPEPEDPTPDALAPTIFGQFDTRQISKVLKEMYFEGKIDYSMDGERIAQMDAVYVDMVDGHGWIQNCELIVGTKIGRVRTDLVVRADWLRHSADGSLSADYAEVSACDFAKPHYFIRTKNLRLKPIGEGTSVWEILLKDNSLIFDYGLEIPLPRVRYKSDARGRPTFSGLQFGDSARYGTFVEASLDVDVGESLTETVAPILGVEPEEIDGSYRIKASYYNARGLLLDQRFRVTAGERFWMNMYLDGLYDSGEDRGMVRYKGPADDGFRWVLNSQSRYLVTGKEWYDIVFSSQSDPGVQAEFTESQFVRYERRDTYVRWRKASNQHYYSANARYRANEFRNDLERLPDIGMIRGLTPFAEVWGQPLLYTATADAVYLRRRVGTRKIISPFDPLYEDDLGNREVVRGDTRHRIEAPFELGLAGIRVSPYTSFEATAWSEGVDRATSPTRGAIIAGVEAQTTFFRTWSQGVVNTMTPLVGYRGDLASFEEDGEPMRLDYIDRPLTGRFFDVGLRSRWRVPGGSRYLDTAIRGTHADAVYPGEEDGWQPIRVLGELLAMIGGVPFAITHDAQYDLDDGDTLISSSSLSVLPYPSLGVELAYSRGLDDERQRLYEALSMGTRWDATPKWQVEARQSLSQIDNTALSSEFLLRRLGHDFIFELSYSFRSGEGGSSVTFKYRPLLGWKSPNFGSMQALQRARL